jgi:hypothetical protein
MVGSLARVSHVIGWVMLSRKAVASAEQALRADQQGVRDEIGFLTLHQAFADRFFPGTSVLHTRLRYVLFVPWLMQHSDGDPERFRREALVLTAQLNLGQKQPGVTETGVIGGSIWPSEPSQTPAMAYWSALAHWGILQPRRGLPSLTRTQVLQRLSAIHDSKGQQVEIDGESIWFADIAPFVTLPTPPADFLKLGCPLDFALAKDERPFLRNQLMAVRRGAPPTDQSLLGRLVYFWATLILRGTRQSKKSLTQMIVVCSIWPGKPRRSLALAARRTPLWSSKLATETLGGRSESAATIWRECAENMSKSRWLWILRNCAKQFHHCRRTFVWSLTKLRVGCNPSAGISLAWRTLISAQKWSEKACAPGSVPRWALNAAARSGASTLWEILSCCTIAGEMYVIY